MADLTVRQVMQKLGKDILNWIKTNCVDNLVSTSKNLPLSANQGRVLKEGQDAINQSLEDHFSVEFIASSVNAVSGALIPNEYQNINYDIIVILWNLSNGLYDEFRFVGSALNSTITNRSMSHGGYTSANYYERSQILMNSGRITLNSWIHNGTEYKTSTLMTIIAQKKRSKK